MVSRTVNISFPETRNQIAGIFSELDSKNRGEVVVEPAKFEIAIPISSVPEIIKNQEIATLYNSGRVSKKGGGEGTQIISIPQEDDFQPLVDKCGAIAENVTPLPAIYTISVSSKNLKAMLDESDKHSRDDFARALGNYADEVELNEVIVMKRWIGFARITQISVNEDEINPQGFIKYIQDGSFTKPSLTSRETQEASDQMMVNVKRAGVAMLLGIFATIAWAGNMLLQAGKKATESNNNKIDFYMNYGEEESDYQDNTEYEQEEKKGNSAVRRLEEERKKLDKETSLIR